MSARYRVKLEVNGAVIEIEVEARETLLDALRHRLGLTGTHAGCEEGSCGACTVLIDGDVVRSCLVLAVQLEGRSVITIESLGEPNDLHPVQEALRKHHGLQCGFCTPGVVLTAVDLLARNPSPTEPEIRQALAGNLCRCTGYAGIVAAVLEVARPAREKP
jgi:aerobic-type carbon monoxide dehydrogenase small subunit (CoxS/CutS family)